MSHRVKLLERGQWCNMNLKATSKDYQTLFFGKLS